MIRSFHGAEGSETEQYWFVGSVQSAPTLAGVNCGDRLLGTA
jgi:hypothetical protein